MHLYRCILHTAFFGQRMCSLEQRDELDCLGEIFGWLALRLVIRRWCKCVETRALVKVFFK